MSGDINPWCTDISAWAPIRPRFTPNSKPKRPKNIFFALFLKKVAKTFGQFKKTPYLCNANEGETSWEIQKRITQAQNQEKEQTQKENQTKTTANNEVTKKEDVKVVQSGNSANEITQQEARKLAVKQFKELDEKWVREKELEVLEFSRANEYYYYISSKENTIEIKKNGGKITRINSVPVQ